MRQQLRIFPAVTLLFTLLPITAMAADEKCKLELWTQIPLIRSSGGALDYVPVKVNGAQKNFIFDTGGFYTQISRPVAEELKLPIRQSDRGGLIDATGKISRDQAMVHEFMVGNMRGTDIPLNISPHEDVDGLFALDRLERLDVDVDFGTDTLKFFSPDHCDGQVVYWTNPTSVAVVPFTMDGFHIRIPVTLDGREVHAVIDTGASGTILDLDTSQALYDLTLGDSDTPEAGNLNNDPTLKTYRHTFKSLSFGNISVANPQIFLFPNAVGRNLSHDQLVGNRTKSEKDLISQQDVTVGMNILRKLHVYFAFGERKMYISEASQPALTSPVASPAH